MSTPCEPFSMYKLGVTSLEVNLFFQLNCLDSKFKFGVYVAWIILFIALICYLIYCIVKEWIAYGYTKGINVLFFSLFSMIALLVYEFGQLFQGSLLLSIISFGFAFWFFMLSCTSIAHAWFKVLAEIRVFLDARGSFEENILNQIVFISFHSLSFIVLFGIWMAGFGILEVHGTIDIYNLLIAIGMGWLGFCSIVISLSFVLIYLRVKNILKSQKGNNQSSKSDPTKKKIFIYSITQFVIFLLFSIVFFATMIWGIFQYTQSQYTLNYFYLSQFVFNTLIYILIFLITTAINSQIKSSSLQVYNQGPIEKHQPKIIVDLYNISTHDPEGFSHSTSIEQNLDLFLMNLHQSAADLSLKRTKSHLSVSEPNPDSIPRGPKSFDVDRNYPPRPKSDVFLDEREELDQMQYFPNK